MIDGSLPSISSYCQVGFGGRCSVRLTVGHFLRVQCVVDLESVAPGETADCDEQRVLPVE